MNLWHDISKGKDFPNEFVTVVEVPQGSHNKYEITKEDGMIFLDRVNYGPSAYPVNYGFIPQTLWEDGDALDVVLIATNPIPPGVLVPTRPVALMEMIDDGDNDYKIIGVPIADKRYDEVQDLADINKHSLKEYKDFWENIKNLKGAKVGDHPVSIDNYADKTAAIEAMHKSVQLYEEKFGKK